MKTDDRWLMKGDDDVWQGAEGRYSISFENWLVTVDRWLMKGDDDVWSFFYDSVLQRDEERTCERRLPVYDLW